MSTIKATPLIHLTEVHQHTDLNGCIIGDKVYQAKPTDDGGCEGCEFTTDGMPEHCIKVSCTPGQRNDRRDVIWVEKVNHYNGHEVSA